LKVVAVVPTHNERGNIENPAGQVFSTIPAIEVLVVDDMSPDGTGDAARTQQSRFPRLKLLYRTEDRGFGPAYLAGFREVMQNPEIDAILMMDTDLSHKPAHVPAMLERIASCGAVIGSRYTEGGGASGWELRNRILSKAGNRYVRAVAGMPFRDCASGFNLIRTDLLCRLDLLASGGRGVEVVRAYCD
jgi:dolichol-phosphate mannosyltransferase